MFFVIFEIFLKYWCNIRKKAPRTKRKALLSTYFIFRHTVSGGILPMPAVYLFLYEYIIQKNI